MNITPSPQQEAVFDAIVTRAQHLMIRAFAGTGKTTTLTMILTLIKGEVFMGAYNVEIKDELIRKVNQLRLPQVKVTIKTMHGAGNSALIWGKLKSQWPNLNESKMAFLAAELAESTKDEGYLTYERFLVKLCGFGKRAGVGVLAENDATTWEELIDYYGVTDELPDEAYDDEGDVTDRLIAKLIKLTKTLYQYSIDKAEEEIDYDDQLFLPLMLNKRFPKYDYVFLDEAQDCSAIRQEIAVRMLKPNGRLIFCGDSFQNIYGFTGCLHNELDILRERMTADVLPLSVTYRCPKRVVEVANTWVPELTAHESNPDGVVRSVYLEPTTCIPCGGTGRIEDTRQTDGEGLCKTCKGTGKSGPGFWDEAHTLGAESVILCRNNKPLVELAYQLLRKNIPCQIAGRDFAGSLIKLCQRWKTRDLNVLEERLVTYREHEAEKWRKKRNPERAGAVEDKVDTVLALLDGVRSAGKTKVSDLVDRINTMFMKSDKQAGPPRVLTLSSIHKAKGKEWERVYILGRNRYQPSKWAKKDHEIQAENNLLYVAVTRAKYELVDIIVTAERSRKG